MLDRIQVWGPPWLLHSLNSMVLKERGHHPSSVGTGIVILENGVFSHIFGQMARLEDFIPVPRSFTLYLTPVIAPLGTKYGCHRRCLP